MPETKILKLGDIFKKALCVSLLKTPDHAGLEIAGWRTGP